MAANTARSSGPTPSAAPVAAVSGPAHRREGPAASPSLHGRILADVEDAILSGVWPPGHRIAGEHALAAHYGCSRMTVNKVLTQLAQAGLIERRRKAGTFVRRPLSQAAVLEIKDIRAEVAEQGLAYSFAVLARARRQARLADRSLLRAEAGPVLDITCRHDAGGRPFCLEHRLIDLRTVPEAAAEDFAALSPGAWLIMRVPWTAAEHRIRAVGADAGVAEQLAVPPGAPCLVVERRTAWVERPVTFVRLTYPGEAHELVARFVPAQGG